MLVPTVIMAVIAIILVMIGYYKGDQVHLVGLRSAWKMTYQVLPLLIFAFIIAGMVLLSIAYRQFYKTEKGRLVVEF